MKKPPVSENLELMKEWNREKNNQDGISPESLTCGSSKRVWWKCASCGHEWKTKITHRSRGSKCPACTRLKLSLASRAESLEILAPDLCKEWHPAKNDRPPSSYYPHSNKKVWWRCANGHEWQAVISHRYLRKGSCPVCSNKVVISGVNDLATTHPSLIEEWDFVENQKIDITTVSAGSHKKVHWKCKKGHKWEAVIYSRTGKNRTNCPFCSQEARTSYLEKIILFYIQKVFPDAKGNCKLPFLEGTELDIFVPSLKMGIEYDGAFWHQDITKDLKKDFLCSVNGIWLVRIREENLPSYESSAAKLLASKKDARGFFLEPVIKDLFLLIDKTYGLPLCVDINIQRDWPCIEESFLSISKASSVFFSNLILEWDWEKNTGIDPHFVPLYSNRKYWWRCTENHSWLATAGHRANGRNCPFCSGQRVLKGFNDLETKFPSIAQEWDFSQNLERPDEVSAGSHKKFWWICSACGHKWKTAVYVRTHMKCNCPICFRKRKETKPVLNLDTGETFASAKEACEKTGISVASIRACCLGKNRTAGGHRWKYKTI